MKTAHVISLIAVLVGATAFSAMRPVAQWDVVPCQRLKEPFKAGVVAFYDKPFYVEFTINGKKAAKVEKPTLNDMNKLIAEYSGGAMKPKTFTGYIDEIWQECIKNSDQCVVTGKKPASKK